MIVRYAATILRAAAAAADGCLLLITLLDLPLFAPCHALLLRRAPLRVIAADCRHCLPRRYLPYADFMRH